MTFLVILALVNIACFLPMYALNVREQANPFAFLKDSGYFSKATVRLLYARKRYTDPFRINFDYTFLILLAAFFPGRPVWLTISLAAVLAVSFAEILYSSIMHLVFRRTPSLASDMALLRTGWSVAYQHRLLIILAALLFVAALAAVSYVVTATLLAHAEPGNMLLPVFALALLPPCLYNWRRFLHSDFIWRVTYSPALHLFRNIQFGRRTREILTKDATHFERLNPYTEMRFDTRPNVVIVCIESYGSIVYRDPELAQAIAAPVGDLSRLATDNGYRIASILSEAPIFAGGSWLSYTTLTYGSLFDDAYVYDALFSSDNAFAAYESLFHILERNGYANNLLCPLGGVASRYVDWDAIDRNFRPRRKFDFDSLEYSGDSHRFFVPNDLYVAPDQYSLNFAYEAIRDAGESPFSLFFCTLNSHYPWASDLDAVNDWRQLNRKTDASSDARESRDLRGSYTRAIRYQLDYLFRFLAANADDDLLLIAFGDHQPPIITPESMGKHTPLHVISRDQALVESFLEHGFVSGLDPTAPGSSAIKHEGFLSLLMRAMNAAHGADPGILVEYRENGVSLLHD